MQDKQKIRIFVVVLRSSLWGQTKWRFLGRAQNIEPFLVDQKIEPFLVDPLIEPFLVDHTVYV